MTPTETAQFNAWISEHYEELKERIRSFGHLDEDIFHDTYLALLDALTTAVGVINYDKLFMATYRELRRKKMSEAYRMVNPTDLYFRLLAAEEAEQQAQKVSAKAVKDYARNALQEAEYRIFYLRFVKELQLEYIGEYTGRSTATIYQHTQSIRQRICRHFAIA